MSKARDTAGYKKDSVLFLESVETIRSNIALFYFIAPYEWCRNFAPTF